MRIATVGCRLVSGACFSDFGQHVICIDGDESRIAGLDGGHLPIHEPGLADLVASKWVRAVSLSAPR